MSTVVATSLASPARSHSPARLAELDVLRAVAILLVLGHHYLVQDTDAGAGYYVVRELIRFGWTGVDLFFVLSGFLVGGLLFNEVQQRGHIDVRRFIIRRGFKIWPAYYVFLGFLILLWGPWLQHQGPASGARAMGVFMLFVQNYLEGPPSALPVGQLWSLAIEEHFYLLLPLLLVFLSARNQLHRWFPRVALAVMGLCLLLRLSLWSEPYQFGQQFAPTHLRIDSLLYGALLAYLYRFHGARLAHLCRHPALLASIGVLLVSPMFKLDRMQSPFVRTIGFTCLACGYGCLMLAALYSRQTTGRHWVSHPIARGLAFIGTYSYSIYLWHTSVGLMGAQWFLDSGWLSHAPTVRWLVQEVLYVGGATLAGVVFGKLVELPALALRERLFPAPSRLVLDPPRGPGA